MTQPSYPAGLSGPDRVPPPRRSNGTILAGVVGAIVVLAGLGVAAWYLFLAPSIDTDKVEAEIVRLTQDGGLTPTAVECPGSIPIEAGRVDTCTAVLEGDRVIYTVRQSDDQGNLEISSSGFVVVSKVEKLLVDRIGPQAGIEVVAECADGDRVLVGGPGTTVDCVVSDAANPDDFAEFTATVTDEQGTVEFS